MKQNSITYLEAQSRAGKACLNKYGKRFYKENALKSLEKRYSLGQISEASYQDRKKKLTEELAATE